MLITTYGKDFIGYTGKMKCGNCQNISHNHLYQKYEDEIFLFLRMGKIHSNVELSCPICEKSITLATPKSKRNVGAGLEELRQHLNDGRELTKKWYLDLPSKTRDKVLERYYSFEAFEFMRYLLSE